MTFSSTDSDAQKMHYFRNIKSGEPFEPGQISADYSIQLMMGYANYQAWARPQSTLFQRTMMKIPLTPQRKEMQDNEYKRQPLRGIDQVN
jgi:hypothetical protein